jgi:hypothetical protein
MSRHNSVAVGRGVCHSFHTHRSSSSAAIIDHDLLAQSIAEELREWAHESVGATARWIGNHHP